jgi:hypothetical protein
MNSVAAKETLLKQVIWFALNVFSTRFFYQAANSFAEIWPAENRHKPGDGR